MSTLDNSQLDNTSANFLITELGNSTDRRQHLEGLVDKEVQYFLTLLGVIIALVGVAIQLGTDWLALIITSQLLVVVLGFAGYRLLKRLVFLAYMARCYDAQAGLIRRRFLDFDESISKALLDTIASASGPAFGGGPISRQTSVRFLPYFNSLIVAVTFFSLAADLYLLFSNWLSAQTWIVLLAIGAAVSIVAGVWFYHFQKRNVIAPGDAFSAHIEASVRAKFD